MPSYKVVKRGFHAGRLYDPEGKRRTLHTEKPFPSKDKKEQVPSWLEAVKPETPTQAKARKTAETKAAKAAQAKADDDQKDISEASFLGTGEAPASNSVETL